MTARTDDERRRVAAELRGLNGNVSHVRRVYEDEGSSILCDDQADYYQICHAVAGYLPAEHMHPCDYEELHARLADLIEPPTQCPYYHSDRHYCSIHDVPATPQKVAEEMFGKMCHSTKEEADAYDAMLKSKSVEIHPVDREALLAVAETLEDCAGRGSDLTALGYSCLAKRIREALGVES